MGDTRFDSARSELAPLLGGWATKALESDRVDALYEEIGVALDNSKFTAIQINGATGEAFCNLAQKVERATAVKETLIDLISTLQNDLGEPGPTPWSTHKKVTAFSLSGALDKLKGAAAAKLGQLLKAADPRNLFT